jgi:hypothetical protein
MRFAFARSLGARCLLTGAADRNIAADRNNLIPLETAVRYGNAPLVHTPVVHTRMRDR